MNEWKQLAKKAAQQMPQDPSQQAPPGQAGQQQGQSDPSQIDTATLERNFMDQSYQNLQNLAMPFIQAGKQLGFEVVYKNPDCSKMVGVFIFRVSGKELFYAPALFISGQSKGDLLYRVTTKTFVPLNPDWCDYFLQHAPANEGEGVDPSVKMHANNYADLVSIIQPPRSHKLASADLPKNFNDDVIELLNKTASVVFDEPCKEEILQRFIVEDGGYSAIAKLHKAAKASYAFANALFMSCKDESVYAPDLSEMDKAAAAKDASALPDLAIYLDLVNNPLLKTASTDDLAKGYKIVDNRKSADLNEITWEANSLEMNGIAEPGIFNVLMADGSKSKCLLAYDDHDMLAPSSWHCCDTYRPSAHIYPQFVIVDMSTLESKRVGPRKPVFGTYISGLDDSKEFAETMSSGKTYRVYSRPGKALSEAIHIKSVGKTAAGLAEYTTGYSSQSDSGNKVYIYNPDYDGVIDSDGVIGGAYRFLEVARETASWGGLIAKDDTLKLGEEAAIDRWIFGEGYKKATVTRLPNSTDYIVRRVESEKNSPSLTKLGAKMLLMNELDIAEPAADEIIDLVNAKRQHQFFYKSAQQLQWRQFPEFYQQFNQDFNVPEEDSDSMRYRILAQGNHPMQLRHRVGDGIKLNNPNEDAQGGNVGGVPGAGSNTNDAMQDSGLDMTTATPESLYQLSQQKGVGNLFEHGVIGSLVKTYDAIALVNKYLPDLEQALDRLGRIVFLLAWKPEDFIKAYGTDDQSELENKLMSNFKALGELVLELLQKSKNQGEGTPGLK